MDRGARHARSLTPGSMSSDFYSSSPATTPVSARWPSMIVEQINEAHAHINKARAQEHPEGDPIVAARHYITAMEIVAATAYDVPSTDQRSRRYFLCQLREKMESYYARAELLLQVAEECGGALLDRPTSLSASGAAHVRLPPVASTAPLVCSSTWSHQLPKINGTKVPKKRTVSIPSVRTDAFPSIARAATPSTARAATPSSSLAKGTADSSSGFDSSFGGSTLLNGGPSGAYSSNSKQPPTLFGSDSREVSAASKDFAANLRQLSNTHVLQPIRVSPGVSPQTPQTTSENWTPTHPLSYETSGLITPEAPLISPKSGIADAYQHSRGVSDVSQEARGRENTCDTLYSPQSGSAGKAEEDSPPKYSSLEPPVEHTGLTVCPNRTLISAVEAEDPEHSDDSITAPIEAYFAVPPSIPRPPPKSRKTIEEEIHDFFI